MMEGGGGEKETPGKMCAATSRGAGSERPHEEDSRELKSKQVKRESEGNIYVTGLAPGGSAGTVNTAGVVHGGMGNTNITMTGADPLHDILARTKDEVEDMTAGMVRVSAVDAVVKKLSSGQHWVTITGNAGDGKTTLGYLVLGEFLQKGVVVSTLYKPDEYDQIAKMTEDKVIMFDDRFGAFLADHQLIKSWHDVIQKISRVIERVNSNTKVIFISRKNVINESKVYLGRLIETIFDRECVVDLSKGKLTEERRKIMDYHLGLENVTIHPEIKTIVCNMEVAHGFPYCCKMFSKFRSKGFNVPIEEFFESPLKFLDMTTKVLYNETCKHLFQLMIQNDGKLDIYTKIEDKDERHDLLKVEKEQEGSYITVWRNGTCQFAHPSVYESVLNVINDIDPLYCVQYATLSVIRQKMIISTSDEEDRSRSPCYIIVRPIPAVLKALAERFREEILKGDYSVYKHRLCQSREFCEALVSCCVTTDKERYSSKQFINRPGQGGETMLWTALKSGGMTAVQTLVTKAKADVTIQDDRERTPLHNICQLKNSVSDDQQHRLHMETIRVIITEGRANVNVYDKYGQTPLHYICQLKTNNDDQHHLHMDTIRVMITEGRGDINTCNQYGQTPLHYLFNCSTFTAEEIQWLITQGKGDLNRCEQHKSTPLHYLCANSSLQLDTVDIVIKIGKGDFNKGDENGTTPFHYLCDNGKVKHDVVLRIVNTANGDINKQDDNGITPLHVLCTGTLPVENILTLINQGDKADRYGNTSLHFLCRRQGINAKVLQVLEQIPHPYMKKQNDLGYTPLDFLTYQDDSLPWTDGMIARCAADLVVCRLKYGYNWIVVLGRAMILNSERVHKELQVEDFGRVLSSITQNEHRHSLGQFLKFRGTCSSPVPVPPSTSPLTTSPSYWETSSTLTRRKGRWPLLEMSSMFPLLEMGVMEGRGNLDEWFCVSLFPDSVCLSVIDFCLHHPDRLCIQVWRNDKEDREGHQVGECVSLSLPRPDVEFTLTFGLVLDVGRGRVGFIDMEMGKLFCKVDLDYKEWISPMFHVYPDDDLCPTRMKLVSGREISITDKKIQLIQQALSD